MEIHHLSFPIKKIWYSKNPNFTITCLTVFMYLSCYLRERPRPIVRSGVMTHLVTSVCSAASCPDGPPAGCVDCKYDHWDFTLVTPLSLPSQ